MYMLNYYLIMIYMKYMLNNSYIRTCVTLFIKRKHKGSELIGEGSWSSIQFSSYAGKMIRECSKIETMCIHENGPYVSNGKYLEDDRRNNMLLTHWIFHNFVMFKYYKVMKNEFCGQKGSNRKK